MTAPPAGALEACPFCGGVQLHVLPPTCNRLSPYDPADRAFPTVRCGCGAEVHGDNWDESCKSAIAAWNRRAHGPALLAALRLREWRPIAEAPKDLQIIGWSPQYGARETRWTLYGAGSPAKDKFDRGEGPEGYWDWSEPMNNWGASWKPTHWMNFAPPTADDLARVLEESATTREAASA